ncbi:diaminopimelate decarboxylase [Phocaeicola sp.]
MEINNNAYRKLKTPFFLLDEKVLLDEIATLRQAISSYWSQTIIGYSVKTNSFPPLLKILSEHQICTEVVSIDEYELATIMGYNHQQIICNGPIKSEAWINRILQEGNILNIDSKRELRYIQNYAKQHLTDKISIGIRVNIDLEHLFPGESNAGIDGSRFGFSYETGELEEAILFLKQIPNVHISGLHLHTSTRTRSIEIYRWLTQLFCNIVAKYQLTDIIYFDIGGGFYGGIPNKPSWKEYIREISSVLSTNGYTPEKLKLIIEPGVSLIAGCFSYHCTVVDTKRTAQKQIVVLDGSRIHIDPLFHKKSYFYEIRKQQQMPIVANQQLVGFTCLENDRFFQLEDEEELNEGDQIIFDKVGAYTMTLSPLFISYFPAIYIQTKEQDIKLLRSKWGVNEFIQLSL